MQRSIVKNLSLRHWLLFGCLVATLAITLFLNETAGARNQFQQSPVSPVSGEAAAPPSGELPAVAPASSASERDVAPIPAEAPAALTLPLGEPLRAQTSLVLVGLVLIGLVSAVVLIVIRQRQT